MEHYTIMPKEDVNMRVPDHIKKCVAFIGVKIYEPNGNFSYDFSGTGFFASVPSDLPGACSVYFVTAKHNVVEMQQDCKEWAIRLNTKDGNSKTFDGIDAKWHYHEDKSVDLAVINWLPPNPEKFDHLHIPTSSFLNSNSFTEQGIGIGDEVCMVGLFRLYSGDFKNEPVLRIGNIAMLPSRRIEIKDIGPMEAYLIEARSMGGLSGSPVFLAEQGIDPVTKMIAFRWHFLGIIHGHYKLKSGEQIERIALNSATNVGVSIVTPAQKLLDILNNEELSAAREKGI
jgi:hypothetical protein